MSTSYQIDDQKGMYFMTFLVIDWVDIFTRKIYRDILLDSFQYCRENKGMMLWAYVIMSNHVHVIMSSRNGKLSDLVRDFKRFTATKILKTIPSIPESRADWMLKRFEFAARRHQRNSVHQFWRQHNHAMKLVSPWFITQKLVYIHLNPVKAGWVAHSEDWLYSSDRNYKGMEALIEIDLLDL